MLSVVVVSRHVRLGLGLSKEIKLGLYSILVSRLGLWRCGQLQQAINLSSSKDFKRTKDNHHHPANRIKALFVPTSFPSSVTVTTTNKIHRGDKRNNNFTTDKVSQFVADEKDSISVSNITELLQEATKKRHQWDDYEILIFI